MKPPSLRIVTYKKTNGLSGNMVRTALYLSARERFELLFEKQGPDDCWLWQAGKGGSHGAYGLFYAENKRRYAHRASYEFYNGPIPKGLLVLHKCDNPPCVNPKHLRLGTVLDNNRDAKAKGRRASQKGENHSRSKITEAQVIMARKRYATGNITLVQLAKELKVRSASIWAAVHGVSWSHISGAVQRKPRKEIIQCQ